MSQPARANEFRRGWRVLLAASVGIALGSTVLPINMFGALIVPLSTEYGWARGDIQFGYMLFTLISAAAYVPTGMLVDRYGARRVALAGIPLFAAGFAAIALTGGTLALFLAGWGLLGFLGAAATPVTFTRFVNEWFVANRGAALAIALILGGVSTAALQFLSTWLAETFGWPSVFLVGAVLPLVMALPLALLWLRAPGAADDPFASAVLPTAATGQTLGEALRGYRFWVLTVSILAVTFGIGGIFLNLKPLLTDRGFAPAATASIAATISLTVIVSRLLTGILIDRIWAPLVALPMFGLPAFACLLLAQPDLSHAAAMLAAMLVGFGAGAEADLIAYFAARYFGLRHYGRIYGALFGLFIAVSGTAPYLFGLTYDAAGSYDSVLLVAAILFILAALLPLTLGRYPDRGETIS